MIHDIGKGQLGKTDKNTFGSGDEERRGSPFHLPHAP